MKRVLEPELMIDQEKCNEYNQISHRQYGDGKFISAFNKYCGLSEGTLIDLGSGPGVHLEELAKNFPSLDITGYENSDIMIELAKQNTSVQIIKDDFYNIDASADIVMCLYTLHHQVDPIRFWSKVSQLSKNAVYIEDFERPEDESFIDKFEAIDDFKHSLRAAYTVDEIKMQLTSLNLNYKVERELIDADFELYKIIVHQKI